MNAQTERSTAISAKIATNLLVRLIINIVYVKTVVGKAPSKEAYRNNNEPLFVYKNGNISFVETIIRKKVGTLCVLTFLNVFI